MLSQREWEFPADRQNQRLTPSESDRLVWLGCRCWHGLTAISAGNEEFLAGRSNQRSVGAGGQAHFCGRDGPPPSQYGPLLLASAWLDAAWQQ